MFKVGEGIAGIQVATFDDTISSDAVKHSLDVSSKVTQQFIAKGKDVGGTFEVGIGTAGVSVVKQTAAPLQSSEGKKGIKMQYLVIINSEWLDLDRPRHCREENA